MLVRNSRTHANQRTFCFLVIMFDTRPALSLINCPPQITTIAPESSSRKLYMENIPGNLCTEPLPPICDSFQTEFNLLAKSSTSLHVKNKPCRYFRPQHSQHYCTMPRVNNEHMPRDPSKIEIEFHGLLYLTEY